MRTCAPRWRAIDGAAYRLVLPWDTGGWTERGDRLLEARRGRIGRTRLRGAASAACPASARAACRVAGHRPAIQPVDASIVSDRLDLPRSRRFDLVLATNVLVYYDTFEQTLALASVAAMLKPGGVLLTNDAVLEIPEVPMRSAGMCRAVLERPGDGERMVSIREVQ